MYIEQINGPEDVKKLNIEEMTAMAAEMRQALSTADILDRILVW